jgi:hypothetical protein
MPSQLVLFDQQQSQQQPISVFSIELSDMNLSQDDEAGVIAKHSHLQNQTALEIARTLFEKSLKN